MRSPSRARRWLAILGRACTSAEYRSILLSRWREGDELHQTTALTSMDRYPLIFGSCQRQLADREALRILSFGCSTGEEVRTLRGYFPSARIVGAEINRRSLALCERHRVDDRIDFVPSEHESIARHAPFDAIFCMAVLQRTPHTIEREGVTSLRSIYPFDRFEQQIHRLDSYLAVGGLLVVHYTAYSLRDTAVAARYAPLPAEQELDWTPKFDRNSERVVEPGESGSMYVKLSA
ncbi:MAG TPA: methyltransferase domain-containing protein [Gemmatimonadales bacterium]